MVIPVLAGRDGWACDVKGRLMNATLPPARMEEAVMYVD